MHLCLQAWPFLNSHREMVIIMLLKRGSPRASMIMRAICFYIVQLQGGSRVKSGIQPTKKCLPESSSARSQA